MSHTTSKFYVGNTSWHAIHNGDFSGQHIEFVRNNTDGTASFYIPVDFILQVVAEMKRRQKISELENANPKQIIGLI